MVNWALGSIFRKIIMKENSANKGVEGVLYADALIVMFAMLAFAFVASFAMRK